MTGNASQQDWTAEFKKLTAPHQAAAASAPGGRSERRQFPRFTLFDATAKLYRRGATALFGLARLSIEGSVVDLSEGGARVLTGEQLLADTKIHLRIEIAKFDDRVEADGLVRWCRRDPKDESRHFAGVAFAAADPSLGRKIAQMRAWFTSPQAVALRGQRLREEERRRGRS